MGGKSSKSKGLSKDEKQMQKSDTNSKKASKKKDKKKRKSSKKGMKSASESEISSIGSKVTTGLSDRTTEDTNREFSGFVMEALKNKAELVTLADIEAHISKNHRSVVDAFNRKKIIRKVVTDEISKGNVTIRLIRGGCP